MIEQKWLDDYKLKAETALMLDNNVVNKNLARIILKLLGELKVSRVELPVSDDFGEPTINQAEFNKWLSDQKFYSESEGTPIDKYILESYFDTAEQFIKSPKSKATKSVFEVATQTIKKYLSQNSR